MSDNQNGNDDGGAPAGGNAPVGGNAPAEYIKLKVVGQDSNEVGA